MAPEEVRPAISADSLAPCPPPVGRPALLATAWLGRPPRQVFAEFDKDGSGVIDFHEFKEMLPQLGISMSDAKALKYFAMADTDG